MSFTVIVITQVIDHSENTQRIIRSEQSHLDAESLYRSEDISELIHKEVKRLYDLKHRASTTQR